MSGRRKSKNLQNHTTLSERDDTNIIPCCSHPSTETTPPPRRTEIGEDAELNAKGASGARDDFGPPRLTQQAPLFEAVQVRRSGLEHPLAIHVKDQACALELRDERGEGCGATLETGLALSGCS